MEITEYESQIVKTLAFYGRINRPLTLLEIWRRSRGAVSATLDDADRALDALVTKEKVFEDGGFFHIRDGSRSGNARADVMRRVFQDINTDGKWKKFLSLRRIFRFVPFVEFVFASGSMAVGNAGPLSDFDVIIGARGGRIFTVRAACIALFGMAGKRRKKFSHHDEANNKICLNHFVTPPAYRLAGPYNAYWEQLYKNLVPLAGSEQLARDFISANEWAHAGYAIDRRFIGAKNIVAVAFEWLLNAKVGDIFERVVRAFQQRRIEKGLIRGGNYGFKPRITYSDSELEFHPDTARIGKMINSV